MHVWQVPAVLWLVAFIGACDRSPDHTTTSAAAAVCCVIVSNEHSPEARQQITTVHNNSSMQRACLPPADYRTTTLPPSRSSSMRVWQVRAVLWLVGFVGACDRSPVHTTSLCRCLLLSVIVYHITQHCCQCDSDNRQQQHKSQQCKPTSICCSLLSPWALSLIHI